jgi:hypothetical protein
MAVAPASSSLSPRVEATLEAGELLVEEWVSSGRVKTAEQEERLCESVLRAAAKAAEKDEEDRARREHARHWRERLPDVAEAMLAPPAEAVPYWRECVGEDVSAAMLAGSARR